MSWLDPAWARRSAIAVDNIGGADAAADIRFTVPPAFSWFWDAVLSTGYDVRVATADGVLLTGLKRETWTYATRAATFAVAAAPLLAGTRVFWLYWANANAADVAAAPTITTPKVGTFLLSRPTPPKLVRVGAERHGSILPVARMRKGSAEAVRVWWDFRDVLEAAAAPVMGSRLLEEIAVVLAVTAVDADEVAVDAMVDLTLTGVTGHWVATWLQAGTAGSSYILTCRVKTSFNRILEGRALLEVKNVEI